MNQERSSVWNFLVLFFIKSFDGKSLFKTKKKLLAYKLLLIFWEGGNNYFGSVLDLKFGAQSLKLIGLVCITCDSNLLKSSVSQPPTPPPSKWSIFFVSFCSSVHFILLWSGNKDIRPHQEIFPQTDFPKISATI